jgi:hypothetical protein
MVYTANYKKIPLVTYYYVSGHQFAWFVLYNETVNRIDHINRIKTDNRPANLRRLLQVKIL